MLLRSILTIFLALSLLQNACAYNDDWETAAPETIPVDNRPSSIDTSTLGPQAVYEMPTPAPNTDLFPGNDFYRTNTGANFPVITPVDGGMAEAAQNHLAEFNPREQTMASVLPPLPPGLEYDLPPVPAEVAETLTSLPVVTSVAAGQAASFLQGSMAPLNQNALTQEKTMASVLPPLPPGLEYDLPPMPAEVAETLTSLPVVTSVAAGQPMPLPQESATPPGQGALIQEKTMASVLPPLPPGLEYDLPPMPAEVAETLTSLPVITSVAAGQAAPLPQEAAKPIALAKEKIAEAPASNAGSGGTISMIDTFLTNALARGMEAKNEEINNLGKPRQSIDPPAGEASANAPAPMDPVMIRELDKLGRDSVGKEYHNDLVELIQKMKVDPQSFSTNTVLQAKFDNILERAARDEAPSTNSPPSMLATNTPTRAVQGAATPPLAVVMPASSPAEPQNFLTDYNMDIASAPQASMPNYVEDWPKLEAEGKPAAMAASQDNRQAGTHEQATQEGSVDNLKEVLMSLKGGRYEQDAQDILAQIQTNAPPELYEDKVKALIHKIDSGAQAQADTLPSRQPIKLLILENHPQAISVPDIARDSQSRHNTVTTITPPR